MAACLAAIDAARANLGLHCCDWRRTSESWLAFLRSAPQLQILVCGPAVAYGSAVNELAVNFDGRSMLIGGKRRRAIHARQRSTRSSSFTAEPQATAGPQTKICSCSANRNKANQDLLVQRQSQQGKPRFARERQSQQGKPRFAPAAPIAAMQATIYSSGADRSKASRHFAPATPVWVPSPITLATSEPLDGGVR